jgi:hypothetical protein
MHVKITAGIGPEAKSIVIADVKSDAYLSDAVDFDDAALRMLTAMLAGDLMVRKDGFLFQDGEPRFYLYGQQQNVDECLTRELLSNAGCIELVLGLSLSPALKYFAVTDFGWHLAKEIRTFRTEVYNLA